MNVSNFVLSKQIRSAENVNMIARQGQTPGPKGSNFLQICGQAENPARDKTQCS